MKSDSVTILPGLGRVGLRILATSDLHAHLRAFDYHTGREDPSVGLSRAASVIARLRATSRNSLLVDCGDFLLGDALDAGSGHGGSLPVVAAMNALDYAAAALGNHEFDRGVGPAIEAARHCRFPLLSANALASLGRDPLHDVPLISAYRLLDMAPTDERGRPHPMKIGLIGFTPPFVSTTDRPGRQAGVLIRDIVDSARAWIPELRRRGADIVVALCHSGIAESPHDTENVARDLALLGGIDALILGHRHKVFPGPDYEPAPDVDPVRGRVAGIPAVMPGCWGRQVGAIDLTLVRRDGAWIAAEATSRCHAIAERRSDGRVHALVPCAPSVLRVTEEAHLARIGASERIVGHSPHALHTYFSRLGYCPVTTFVARAQARAVERALAATPHAGLPVVGIAAPVRSGGLGGPENFTDIPAGPLMAHRLSDMYPFPNHVTGLKLSGALLRDWLERSISGFSTIAPGETLPRLTDPRFPGFDFDMGHGLETLIDLTRPPLFDVWGQRRCAGPGRVAELKLHGAELRDRDEIVVAVNEYRGMGGGNFPGTGAEAIIVRTDTDVRDAMRALLEDGGRPSGPAQTFRFAPVRNALICCQTGPGALAHLGDVDFLPLAHVGALSTGFHAFALDLGRL